MPPSDRTYTSGQVSTLFPKRVSRMTVHRWATKGYRGVVLGSATVGGCRVFTEADVTAFLRGVEKAKSGNVSAADVAILQRKADTRLREMGFVW